MNSKILDSHASVFTFYSNPDDSKQQRLNIQINSGVLGLIPQEGGEGNVKMVPPH